MLSLKEMMTLMGIVTADPSLPMEKPKLVGVSCCPSIKTNSAKYPTSDLSLLINLPISCSTVPLILKFKF